MKPRVLLFTRFPEPGLVKTRLISAIGPELATALHRRMTESIVRKFLDSQPDDFELEVLYTGATEFEMKAWLGGSLSYRRQAEGDLGVRMSEAFRTAFENGAGAVVAIGSDVPSISVANARDAFHALESHDVVVGPATDGGYYLIGMRRFHPTLFANIPWGTESVFELTHLAAEQAGLSLGVLKMLQDIDRPEDLVHVGNLLDT